MHISVQSYLGMRIIDSLNFLPMKLANLPNAFGLTALKKGDFPHFFNTLANQHYKGTYPPPEAYGVDFMSPDERSTFLTWHDQQKHKEFDFEEEILAYCQSDVDILHQACLNF